MTTDTWQPGQPLYDPYGDTTAEQLLSLKGNHCACWNGRRTPSWCADRSPDAATWPEPRKTCDDLEAV